VIPTKLALGLDPRVETRFSEKITRKTTKLERDGDSKKGHPALARRINFRSKMIKIERAGSSGRA
jgi:hypothetical protein